MTSNTQILKMHTRFLPEFRRTVRARRKSRRSSAPLLPLVTDCVWTGARGSRVSSRYASCSRVCAGRKRGGRPAPAPHVATSTAVRPAVAWYHLRHPDRASAHALSSPAHRFTVSVRCVRGVQADSTRGHLRRPKCPSSRRAHQVSVCPSGGCCLLLQDLSESCARVGGEERGRVLCVAHRAP